MINKIKDFLKSKLRKKASNDFSDQEDQLEDSRSFSTSHNDSDDHLQVTVAGIKPNLKDRMTTSFNLASSRLKNLGSSETVSKLSPSLSKSIEKIVSRSFREPIHQGFLVLFICLITYSLGKLTALGIRGTQKIETPRSASFQISAENEFNPNMLNQVKSINIFRTNVQGTKKKLADTKCETATQPSNLPIKLVNTIVLQDSVKSLASVQVRGDRELQEVREGDQISNMARIFKITRLEMLVKNLENGICESISSEKARETMSPISVMSPEASKQFKLNKKMSGIDNEGNKFAISKALLDDKLKDIANILTQARAIKIQNPDGSIAFKLTELDPQGIFPYLGIQDQDIITSINGKPIYDMNEVMMLFGRIKNLDKLSLGIKREGTESTQEYSIKK